MQHPTRPRAHTVRVHLAALVALPMVLLAMPAHAQLGGLVKKARSAATGEASRRSGATAVLDGETVAFNDVILELNEARLDQVIRGLQSAASSSGANARAALVTQRDKASEDAAALSSQHSETIDAHNRKSWQIEQCRNDAFQARHDSRQKGLQQKMMNDGAFRAQVMEATMRLADAQARGDSVALAGLVRDIRVMSGESKADTVAVDASCGAVPAKLLMDLKIQSLNAQARDLDRRIRDADDASAEQDAKAAGMDVRQFAMARERIEMYLAYTKSNARLRGFTTTELRALESRRATLTGLA